jgi:hypothetical protein
VYNWDITVFWNTYSTVVGCASFVVGSQDTEQSDFESVQWINGGSPGYGQDLYDVMDLEPGTPLDYSIIVINMLNAYVEDSLLAQSQIPSWSANSYTSAEQSSAWIAKHYIEMAATTDYGTIAEKLPNGEYPLCIVGNIGVSSSISECQEESNTSGYECRWVSTSSGRRQGHMALLGG